MNIIIDIFLKILDFIPPSIAVMLIIAVMIILVLAFLVKRKILSVNTAPFKDLSVFSYLLPALGLTVLAILLFYYTSPKSLSTSPRESNVQGVSTPSQENPSTPSEISPLNCGEWNLCTDFIDDDGLENKYYTHTSEDSQKLILEDGPFANPPLYFSQEVSPFYTFKLDVLPLNPESGNIFIESKRMFQLFIGDNDYRSLAFIKWNYKQNAWDRDDKSKIYIGKIFKLPDIEPRTQLSIEAETRKKGNDVEVFFTIIYESTEGKPEIIKFSRIIDIPAAEPEKFLTKIGTGMYLSKTTIPQAKFIFMGVKKH